MSKVEEGSGYSWEIPDKSTVKVNEAYEGLHVSPVLWGGPLADSGNLNQVHLDFVLQDDQSKVLDLAAMELALLQAEE